MAGRYTVNPNILYVLGAIIVIVAALRALGLV